MKFILLISSILLSFNCFSQSDTIPLPEIQIELGKAMCKKNGIIDYIPSSIKVRAIGNKDYCKKYPIECRYKVSNLEICIMDKKGAIKYKAVAEGYIKGIDIKNGDRIEINISEVIRTTSRNESIYLPLKKEFIFRIKVKKVNKNQRNQSIK